jgi:Tfp pilus assembly protein PilF
MMKRWLVLSCCAVLVACAGGPGTRPLAGAPLFHDTAFAPPTRPIVADEVFRASPEMLQFVAEAPPPSSRNTDPRRHLVDLLYRGKQNVAINYDASFTHNAAETFRARAGNCLSLMIMTASLARELDLPVQFRSVEVDDSWSRNGDLLFASGHVNIALERPPQSKLRFANDLERELVMDFVPAGELRRQRSRPITQATVLSMFMNNRAAESLAQGNLSDAYWYAREAVLQDPRYLTAYNTLGVVYLRQNRPEWARQVFEAVLERETENVKVMGNLVGALQALGQTDEAARLAATLVRLEPHPPYHYFNAGIEAMQAQDYAAARDLFNKEVARQAYNAEFHFWLAQANFRLGQVREARRHMEQALENSTTTHDHAIYAAKLDWLRGQNTH